MSFKEIKILRQAGKLEEALEMANKDLATDPENIWNKRSIAWVYYEFLKKDSHFDSFDLFKENLIKIKELNLPEEEKMIFDSCAWQIGKMVFSLNECKSKTGVISLSDVFALPQRKDELFDIIKEFNFTKPSEAYSFIYKAFHKSYEDWKGYLQFADWWDFENFRSEDYQKEEFNGKKIMSIVEQAYIAYSKKLLDIKDADYNEEEKSGKIKEFLPQLDRIIEKQPDYQYPSYFKAKLLLTLGDEENILSAFIPFAKQKRNDFWVWELMAEIFSENDELKFACYCKALSLKTPEDFLVKLRQTFAAMLIEKEMFQEAKTEIEIIISTRSKQSWKIQQ